MQAESRMPAQTAGTSERVKLQMQLSDAREQLRRSRLDLACCDHQHQAYKQELEQEVAIAEQKKQELAAQQAKTTRRLADARLTVPAPERPVFVTKPDPFLICLVCGEVRRVWQCPQC